MKKIFVVCSFSILLFASAAFILAGCASGQANAQTPQNAPGVQGNTFRATPVTPVINNDNVSVAVNDVSTSRNVEFNVKFDQGTASFMAYTYNNSTYVRASICVPCRGRSYTLKGSNLVCDTCGTVFSAQTGKGISGVTACKSYPKASVAYTMADGNIVMTKADLLQAFETTLQGIN